MNSDKNEQLPSNQVSPFGDPTFSDPTYSDPSDPTFSDLTLKRVGQPCVFVLFMGGNIFYTTEASAFFIQL